MRKNAEVILKNVLKHEGGYAERPEEGGGAVNRGITFETFVKWREKQKATGSMSAAKMLTWVDLKAMTEAEAMEIYRAQYMTPIFFDDLPTGVDYAIFDAAVNGGVGGAARIMQRSLNHAVDGKFTKRTSWGARVRHPIDLINKICDDRIATYKKSRLFNKVASEKTTKTWGQIWTTRIETVRKRSIKMHEEEMTNA